HPSALKFLSLNLQRRRPSASGQVMWLPQLPVIRILVLGNKNCKVVCFFSHLLVGVLDQVPEHLRLHPTTGGKSPRGLPSLPSAGFTPRLPLSSTPTFVRQGLVMAQWKSSMHNYEQVPLLILILFVRLVILSNITLQQIKSHNWLMHWRCSELHW